MQTIAFSHVQFHLFYVQFWKDPFHFDSQILDLRIIDSSEMTFDSLEATFLVLE